VCAAGSPPAPGWIQNGQARMKRDCAEEDFSNPQGDLERTRPGSETAKSNFLLIFLRFFDLDPYNHENAPVGA
jgi:hypothetical protein